MDEDSIRARVREVIAARPEKGRTQLLEVLHEVQAAFQSVPRAAAEEIEREMGVPVTDTYGVVTFYDLLTEKPTGRTVLRICEDVTCHLHGAEALAAAAQQAIGPEGQPTADGALSWTRCACLGLCDKAPAAHLGEEPLAPCTTAAVAKAGGSHV